ncbi:hypothetical protein BH24ACT26_BH24ACT26_21010 [soil metagenome]
MRPLRLRLKGFTSFRDEQVIDFTELDLFSLWGPTGSGKSSVLDAMTYALYGHVDRVGKHPREVVSQGQPRVAVTLEFSVDDQRYLVARTTSASGNTTVRLEQWGGEDWLSLSGGDSVKEANRRTKDIVGLDYKAFSRSVVLPQGKFAEFLNGEPGDRRSILTELLGLELFKRMMQHSNEIAREARSAADHKQDLVEREYGGIDDAVVAAAHAAAARAHDDAEAAAQAERSLEEALRAWEEEERAIARLRLCADEVAARGVDLRVVTQQLDGHARALSELGDERTAAAAAVATAEREWKAATTELGAAEMRWGRSDEVAALRQEALRWGDAKVERAAAEESLGGELDGERAAEERVKLATEAMEAAKERSAAAAQLLARRREAHESAHRQDAVASLVVDLEPGDPCPVCAVPLAALPEVSPELVLEARAELGAAEDAERAASEKRRAADRDLAVAKNSLELAGTVVARCRAECERKQERLEALSATVAEAFEDRMPDDPSGSLSERLETLRGLDAAQKKTRTALEGATGAARELEGRAGAITVEVARIRGGLESGELRAAVARAEAAAPAIAIPVVLAQPLPDDAGSLARAVEGAAEVLGVLGEDLSALVERRAAAQGSVASAARAGIPDGLGIEGHTLADLVSSAGVVARDLAGRAAVARSQADSMEDKLRARAVFEEEIGTHRRDHAVYAELGKELRDDRIVQFLQAEALRVLALAATERLRTLSETRYRMVYEQDEFFVVDAWNGDERRSVRTLSGGETFVASLALALALSEQVQTLAVSQKSKLESLFLDEGFGNLDAETLEVVVGAIEQLGGDGRLVGVITHVSEVAARLPARLEVTKTSTGSSISRATTEPAIG